MLYLCFKIGRKAIRLKIASKINDHVLSYYYYLFAESSIFICRLCQNWSLGQNLRDRDETLIANRKLSKKIQKHSEKRRKK